MIVNDLPKSFTSIYIADTSGVNTILRSLEFNPGDEIIVTNHTYQACRNSLDFIAKKYSAVVVVCEIPFPVESSQIIIGKVL